MRGRWAIVLPFVLLPMGLARPEEPIARSRGSETILAPSDGRSQQFGVSAAVDGDTALIGANFDDDNGHWSGSAYVFVRGEETWTQQAKLLPTDGREEARFGDAVALDGDTAVVGASAWSSFSSDPGAAYVFVRESDVWIEEAKLVGNLAQPDDAFGISVSLQGDTALVGAFRDNEAGSAAGAAYVFVRNGSAWSEQAKLLPSGYGGQFGRSVSLSGDTALVGAPFDGLAGRAYVFVRSGNTWTEQAQLELDHFGNFDGIGRAVSLVGDTALVGAPVVDYKGSGPGSAYVFERRDGIWSLQAKLLGSEAGEGAFFGGAVSLSASRALIGARGGNEAYVFVRDAGGWSEETRLQPSNGGQAFGVSVSLWEDRTALIGDPATGPPYSARAYVYELDPIELSVVGSCPGRVDITIAKAPPDSDVMIVAGTHRHSGGVEVCGGTVLEVAEPFQLPPLWIHVDGSGSGFATMTLGTNRCWLEALSVENCSTSRAVRAQ